MQIMTIFIDQFLSEKSEIDGKANTLAMVFVRYTMDHDWSAYVLALQSISDFSDKNWSMNRLLEIGIAVQI